MDFIKIEDFKLSQCFFELKLHSAVKSFIICLVLSLVAALLWAGLADIDETLKARSLVRPLGTVSSVRNLTNGQVIEKYWQPDKWVDTGDLLWVINTTEYQVQRENIKLDLMQNLNDLNDFNEIKQCYIQDENIINPNNADAYLKAQVYFSDLKNWEERINQAQIRYNQEKSKPENMTTTQNIKDLESELFQLQTSFSSWKSNQLSIITDQSKQLRLERRSLENSLINIEKIIEDSFVRAPIAGRVVEIKKVNIGDYILNSEEILRIIPYDESAVKLEIYVDSSKVAKIVPGQEVKIRFPGLSASEYGQLTAVIDLVPADSSFLTDNVPFFIIEAHISNPYLANQRGEIIHIRPGMEAEARIILSRKKALRMILNKLDFLQG